MASQMLGEYFFVSGMFNNFSLYNSILKTEFQLGKYLFWADWIFIYGRSPNIKIVLMAHITWYSIYLFSEII